MHYPSIQGGGTARRLQATAIIIALSTSTASAHDAEQWLKDLSTPYSGACCAGNDVVTDPPWEWRDGHYRVMLEHEWFLVPDKAVLDPHQNRDGLARVWPIRAISPPRIIIRCFLPGNMT